MTARSPMRQADQIFSKLIRHRDGHCLAVGYRFPCSGNLQCAHIHTRAYKSIRCDFDNAVTLCGGHHVFFTHRPLEWADWVEAMFPGRWDELKRRALRYDRVNWPGMVRELRKLEKETV